MKLYKVSVTAPVSSGTYYAAAEDIQTAEKMVLAQENNSELQCGGVLAIEVVAAFGRDEDVDTLLISDHAAEYLGCI